MSRPSTEPLVRSTLLAFPDGLTVTELAQMLNLKKQSVSQTLKNMPDAYIDRWCRPRGCPFTAVWMAVEIPENCPHPTGEKHGA